MMDIKKKPEGYFTTGEFAKLCKVKKQTLFHYDHIGILKPEGSGRTVTATIPYSSSIHTTP